MNPATIFLACFAGQFLALAMIALLAWTILRRLFLARMLGNLPEFVRGMSSTMNDEVWGRFLSEVFDETERRTTPQHGNGATP